MYRFINGLLLLVVFFSSTTFSFAQEAPLDSVVESTPLTCFDFYSQNKVKTLFKLPVETALPDDTLTFSGVIVNEHSFPLLDATVSAKIFKRSESNVMQGLAEPVVDQFVAVSNLTLLPNSETDISIDWKVPVYIEEGDYYAAFFVTANNGYAVMGKSFADEQLEQQVDFKILSQSKNVFFDKLETKINGREYKVTEPFVVAPDEVVTITAVVHNPTDTIKTIPLQWNQSALFADSTSVQNTKTEVVTLEPNESKEVTYNAITQRSAKVYVSAVIQDLDVKNYLNVSFARELHREAQVLFSSVNAYPISAGEDVTVFACASAVSNLDANGSQLTLTLTDMAGEVIHEYVYTGEIGTLIGGYGDTFVPEVTYEHFTLTTQLKYIDEVVFESSQTFNCENLDSALCAKDEVLTIKKIDTMFIVGSGAVLLLLLMILFISSKKKKRLDDGPSATTLSSLLFLLALGFMVGVPTVDAQSCATAPVTSWDCWNSTLHEGPYAPDNQFVCVPDGYSPYACIMIWGSYYQTETQTYNNRASIPAGYSACVSYCPTPPPPPPAAATISGSNCVITAGNNTCTGSLTWNITNASSPNVYNSLTGATYSSAASGSGVSVTLRYNSNGILARNGGTTLTSTTLTANCAGGTTWNGSVCAAPPTPPPPPPPPPPAAATISGSNCVITAGNSTCTGSLTWNITNASSPNVRNQSTNVQLSSGASGSGLSVTLPYGTSVFAARNGSSVLASRNLTATCASGTSWNGGQCITPPPPPPPPPSPTCSYRVVNTCVPGKCSGTNVVATSFAGNMGSARPEATFGVNATVNGVTQLFSTSCTGSYGGNQCTQSQNFTLGGMSFTLAVEGEMFSTGSNSYDRFGSGTVSGCVPVTPPSPPPPPPPPPPPTTCNDPASEVYPPLTLSACNSAGYDVKLNHTPYNLGTMYWLGPTAASDNGKCAVFKNSGTGYIMTSLWTRSSCTVTPPPPPPPPPPATTVDLKINGSDGPLNIALGASLNITWTSNSASNCTAWGSGWNGSVSPSGSASVSAGGSDTYVINCGGNVDSVVVNVTNGPPNPPVINGPATLNPGQSGAYSFRATDPDNDNVYYQIDWESNSVVDITSAVVGSGVTQYANNSWPSTGGVTIRARAIDTTGAASAWATRNVTINLPPPPTASLTPNSQILDPGDSLQLSWTSTNATSCTGNGPGFSTGGAPNGTDSSVTPPNPGTSGAYSVTCTGPGGNVTTNTTVSVNDLPNFNQPSVTKTESTAVDLVTGQYAFVTVDFLTTNNGGSDTLSSAQYVVDFDFGQNGYDTNQSGSLGLVPLNTTVNRSESFLNVPFGFNRIRVTVDNGNNVVETNESDNTRVLDFTLPPPDPGISITADRIQVRDGETVTLNWDTVATFPMNCSVVGPNVGPITFDPSASGPTGSTPSGAITAKSEFILSCLEPITSTTFTDSVIVETVGAIEET